jgi:hypothetical protein
VRRRTRWIAEHLSVECTEADGYPRQARVPEIVRLARKGPTVVVDTRSLLEKIFPTSSPFVARLAEAQASCHHLIPMILGRSLVEPGETLRLTSSSLLGRSSSGAMIGPAATVALRRQPGAVVAIDRSNHLVQPMLYGVAGGPPRGRHRNTSPESGDASSPDRTEIWASPKRLVEQTT